MDAEADKANIHQLFVDALQRIAPPAADELGLDTEEQRERLVAACIEMFNAGLRAGASQSVAQLVEQGADITMNLDPNLLPRAEQHGAALHA